MRLPRASIAGTITVADGGAAVAGALVCAAYAGAELTVEERRQPTCARSGADGGYQLDTLAPGAWNLTASADGRPPARWRGPLPELAPAVRVEAGEAKRGIDLVLRPGGVRVRGVVNDIGGGPIADAWVAVESTRVDDTAFHTRSGADGSFTAWLMPGDVRASATADGYAEGRGEGVAPTEQLEILLSPGATLAGVMVEAGTGTPVEGATVVAEGTWWEAGSTGSARTNERGEFRITGLQPGRYKPTAQAT
ncbi:MAG: carboxypeptidase-like regulatory domain-containing protein, partial [Kofleriaceae bacterium]